MFGGLQLNFFLFCAFIQGSFSGPSHRIFKEENNCNNSNTCLKVELLRFIQLLANTTRLQIAPGVLLTRTDRTATLENKLRPLATSPLSMQPFLGEILKTYIDSLNVTFQLGESAFLTPLQKFGLELWNPSISTGRSRYKYRTSWYAIRIIATVGFAMLAALCSKALMASILALTMSAFVALRASGLAFGSPTGRVTQYEIISKPAYSTAPASNYYEHDHYHIGSPYSYSKREVDVPKDN